jgi:FtsP/CotA-like multicopper oxidase with cupredoxin domain
MRSKLFILSALIGMLALTVALPASANNVPEVGTDINLMPGLIGPTTLPANSPFHVAHGWGCGDQAAVDAASGFCLDPETTFYLFINGVKQPAITDLEVSPGGIVEGRIMVSNFPAGLPAGTYLFEGQWWANGVNTLTSDVYVTFT